MIWKVERWDWDPIKKVGWWTQIISVVNEKEADQLIQNYKGHGFVPELFQNYEKLVVPKLHFGN